MFLILFLDENSVRMGNKIQQELRYFREETNSDEDVHLLKKRARIFLRKSPLTGLNREMTMKVRGVLDEILNL